MDLQKSESLFHLKIILIISTLDVTSLETYTEHSEITKHRGKNYHKHREKES